MPMRTTQDIDDDLLATAKELARREHSSAGSVLSRLARQALVGSEAAMSAPRARRARAVGGFQPFASRGVVVSNDAVNALRDAEGV
ncbi:MAG: CopG family transcriptional regulator [Rubrivivax sp.]